MKPAFSPESCHILVVDDEEMNRDMLSRRLERKGYRTTVAVDGFQAQDLVETGTFDLVVLDIMMPKLSGLEVLHALRKKRGPYELPVIMASAKTENDDVLSALKVGANDYVTKPIDFPLALARVEAWLAVKFAMAGAGGAQATAEAPSAGGALDDCPDLHAGTDATGAITWASAAARSLLGQEPAALVGTSIWSLVHPDDRRVRARRLPDAEDTWIVDLRLRRAAGDYVPIELIARVRRGEGGAVEEVRLAGRDRSVRGGV